MPYRGKSDLFDVPLPITGRSRIRTELVTGRSADICRVTEARPGRTGDASVVVRVRHLVKT